MAGGAPIPADNRKGGGAAKAVGGPHHASDEFLSGIRLYGSSFQEAIEIFVGIGA